jgi:hypothetical protein
MPCLGLPSGLILSDYTNKSDAYVKHIGSLQAVVAIVMNIALLSVGGVLEQLKSSLLRHVL